MRSSALRTDDHLDIPFSPELEGPPALEVRAVFNGVVIGTRLLSDAEPARRLRSVHGFAPMSNYTIGQSPEADAPAPTEILGATNMPLVSRWSAGFLINVTPRMTGDVAVDGKVYRLADYLAGRGANFTLPADGRARIDCGAMSFQLQHTTTAQPLPRRWLTWRWSEQKFTLGSLLALGSLLLLCFAIPPDGTSVSSDLMGMSRAFIATTFKPAQVELAPDFLKKGPGKESGASSRALAGESGKAGDVKSKKPTGRLAIDGNSPDTRVGKAEAEARIRDRGILGVLNSATNPAFASIFSLESAIGSAKESVMGDLIAANIDNGWGTGGWNVVGTGPGGGGTGETTLGIDRYHTLGGRDYRPGGIGEPSGGYGPGGGGLRPHHALAPGVIPGTITAHGTLDKEIVRRVVHLHMNEVKYCYDKELVRKTGLEGRVSVQFIIAANGQVINSFMNSTTMNNVNVEKCVIDAVKRWQFPAPAGGGVVIVSYPFNFTAGSGT